MTMTVNPGGTPLARGAILRQFLVLARQKKHRTPAQFARLVWNTLTGINTHRKILQLIKLPPYAEAALNDPRFAFKYLTLDYLGHGFSLSERAACFVHHYRRLYALLPDVCLRRVLQGNITLYEVSEDDHRFAITMGLSTPQDNEGEMSLNLIVDGGLVFILGFTIVPGWVAGLKTPEILLITRLQGLRGVYRQISLATKLMHDVAPGALLLAALQGVASAFGIDEMAGINAARQRAAESEQWAISIEKSYDAFYLELGMTKTPAGFFFSPIPMKEKPLSLIKHGHKIRTKDKRAFKQDVRLACAEFLKEFAPVSSVTLPV
jgi:uncharacterized protein VirK/YbjX